MIDLNREQRLARLIISERLQGAADPEIIETLMASGYDEEVSKRATAACFEYLVRKNAALSRRLGKLRALMSTRFRLQKVGGLIIPTVEAAELSEAEFLATYFSNNLPLRILHADAWFQDLAPLSIRRLEAKFADQSVEVMSGRDSNPSYELNFAQHRRRMTLGEFVGLMNTTSGNDCYMVAHNLALETTALGEVLTELLPGPSFLDSTRIQGNAHLWMGPVGTRTPLHYDLHNIFFLQIEGSKRFHLADPFASLELHNGEGVFSAADLEYPQAASAPISDEISVFCCDLDAGDALFLPVLWWHQVRSLSSSVSISFSNFVYKAQFDTVDPQ